MTDPALLAAVAVAAAAFLLTPPFRARCFGLDRTSVRHWAGALGRLLSPVTGAPGRVVRAAAAVTFGCVLLPLLDGLPAPPLQAFAGGVALFVGLGRWPQPQGRERARTMVAGVPSVCTLLAVCLEAGLPLRNAVAAVADGLTGPVAEVLRRLHASVQLGGPETDAWRELGAGEPAFEQLAREVAHAVESGTALAPVLRHHAHEARRTVAAGAQARARRAGVSSVLPLMACFLPAFLLIGVVPIVGGVAGRLFG